MNERIRGLAAAISDAVPAYTEPEARALAAELDGEDAARQIAASTRPTFPTKEALRNALRNRFDPDPGVPADVMRTFGNVA